MHCIGGRWLVSVLFMAVIVTPFFVNTLLHDNWAVVLNSTVYTRGGFWINLIEGMDGPVKVQKQGMDEKTLQHYLAMEQWWPPLWPPMQCTCIPSSVCYSHNKESFSHSCLVSILYVYRSIPAWNEVFSLTLPPRLYSFLKVLLNLLYLGIRASIALELL